MPVNAKTTIRLNKNKNNPSEIGGNISAQFIAYNIKQTPHKMAKRMKGFASYFKFI